MRFSVVIPTYNRADIICKSIDSVLAQTYTDWEVIVVDNCSTDNTAEVMQQYESDHRIKFIVNDKNYERAYSRNRGMKFSSGEFVSLLDSDDILYPDCLQYAAAHINANPGDRFFHCYYEILDDNYAVKKRPAFPPVHNPYAAIARGNFISNIAVFYSRDITEQVKFDEDPLLIGIEDYDFVLRVLLHSGKVGRIDKYLSGIYDHGGRSVHAEEWNKTKDRVNYFSNKLLANSLFQQKMKPYVSSFLAHNYLYLASFSAVRKKPGRAVKYISAAALKYPAIIFELTFWKHIFVTIKRMF